MDISIRKQNSKNLASEPPRNSKKSTVCPVFFWEKGKENDQKRKDSSSYQTPKIPVKEGKMLKKNKEFLAREKSKEFQKSKERKNKVLLEAVP